KTAGGGRNARRHRGLRADRRQAGEVPRRAGAFARRSCGRGTGTRCAPGETIPRVRPGAELARTGGAGRPRRNRGIHDQRFACGVASTFFWDMPVEDNGFVCTHHVGGQVGWLHASCTEWKNLFCLEIYGKTGKLQIDGLGGSYGVERLAYYRMLPQMGPPETT